MKAKILFCSVLAFSLSLSAVPVTVSYDVSTHQNKRPYQEDRFTHEYMQHNGGEFFGVYDGHGGDKVSSYLQSSVHTYYAQCLGNQLTQQQAFECAFLKTENYALKNFDDGSTAVVAIIDKDNQLHCAWVGDSRAVLESNGTVGFATSDHKPERADEHARIKRAGGDIEFYGVWRVNGLAVSRSIGDRNLKKMGKGQIVAIPEYAYIQLGTDNHFMIIASDGLWDVMSNEDAVNMVQEEFKKTGALKNSAQALQNEAIKRGSGDNITVCVIKFDWLDTQTAAGTPASATTLMTPYALMKRFLDWLRGK